jgi:hypothetical protein
VVFLFTGAAPQISHIYISAHLRVRGAASAIDESAAKINIRHLRSGLLARLPSPVDAAPRKSVLESKNKTRVHVAKGRAGGHTHTLALYSIDTEKRVPGISKPPELTHMQSVNTLAQAAAVSKAA